METLTIGKVARLANVGIETIRFYEREGLLETPARRPSGYREYPREAADRLRFIRRARELGFSLKEIQELLALLDRLPAGAGRGKSVGRHEEIQSGQHGQKRGEDGQALRVHALKLDGPVVLAKVRS